MSTQTAVTTAQDPTQAQATTASTKIQWANAPSTISKEELEQKFEAMRARNWITERMVQQYQKHWHCSREAALERLLSKTNS